MKFWIVSLSGKILKVKKLWHCHKIIKAQSERQINVPSKQVSENCADMQVKVDLISIPFVE